MKNLFIAIAICLFSPLSWAINAVLHELDIHSDVLQRRLKVNLYVPHNYQQTDAKLYPLLVTSAGSSRMAVLRSQVDWLSHVDFGPMPQMIILQLPDIEVAQKEELAQGVYTNKLAQVLHKDIFVYLKSAFRIAPYTVLEGFSSRGNIALELFAQYPQQYQGAIITSPALELADEGWRKAMSKALENTLKGRSLHLSLGSFTENKPHFVALTKPLYNFEQSSFVDLSAENYLSAPLLSFEQGAKWLFSDMRIVDYAPYAKGGIAAVLSQQQRANKKYDYDMSPNGKLQGLANYYFEQGQAHKGKQVFEHLIKHNPTNVNYHLRYAQALLKISQPIAAKPLLESALALAKAQRNEEAQSYIGSLINNNFH
ncbi:alpha/beta hydrolase-fold protein [Pseudoalteromonas byunsanensis]|uniref:Esterase n=1 Tax=Pseudoalteromonas byunsanensis TaxID=327939 RepID=A0A1S1MYP3_9GAMM|nr:alpha/beta hydrolase-fold protein [Pseudoalteromonas byunsanensis]OHU94050.1 hypothetical protein BIW53_17680 [Pseudoalteromonas byunsanensis]